MEHDYKEDGRRITEQFLEFNTDSSAPWTTVKESDLVLIRKRKSPDIKNDYVYKAEVLLDASPERVLQMVSPVQDYRIQWDKFLDRLELVEKIDNDVYLIYHVVKPSYKGLVAARDSIDVITIGQRPDLYFVAAGSVNHPRFPKFPQYVRAWQYPDGYLIYRNNEEFPNKTRFEMVFHADLQLAPMFAVISDFLFADRVKSKLMIEKINNLRQALNTLV